LATSLKETFSSATKAIKRTAMGEKAGSRLRKLLTTTPEGVPMVDTGPTPVISRKKRRILRFLGRRFDPENRAIVFIRQEIEQPVGALANVADALAQLGKQYFAAKLFGLIVEDDPFQVPGPRDFTHPHAADKHIVFP